jgi:hypothetical protein
MCRPILIGLLLVGCSDPSGPRALFNGRNLDGWYSFLDPGGRDNDPNGIFGVTDGMIHILGVDLPPGEFRFGYLSTIEEFENFRVRFEYKWGTRNYVGFGPDSGFFIASVGPDMIWPRSMECQVNLNDTGSMYLFDYTTATTTIDPALPAPTYLEGGQPFLAPRNPQPNYARVTRSAGTQDSLTEWNTVEITASGASVEFVVNGVVSFRADDLKQPDPAFPDDPSKDVPLVRGKFVLQQEGAEIFYRNLVLEPL